MSKNRFQPLYQQTIFPTSKRTQFEVEDMGKSLPIKKQKLEVKDEELNFSSDSSISTKNTAQSTSTFNQADDDDDSSDDEAQEKLDNGDHIIELIDQIKTHLPSINKISGVTIIDLQLFYIVREIGARIFYSKEVSEYYEGLKLAELSNNQVFLKKNFAEAVKYIIDKTLKAHNCEVNIDGSEAIDEFIKYIYKTEENIFSVSSSQFMGQNRLYSVEFEKHTQVLFTKLTSDQYIFPNDEQLYNTLVKTTKDLLKKFKISFSDESKIPWAQVRDASKNIILTSPLQNVIKEKILEHGSKASKKIKNFIKGILQNKNFKDSLKNPEFKIELRGDLDIKKVSSNFLGLLPQAISEVNFKYKIERKTLKKIYEFQFEEHNFVEFLANLRLVERSDHRLLKNAKEKLKNAKEKSKEVSIGGPRCYTSSVTFSPEVEITSKRSLFLKTSTISELTNEIGRYRHSLNKCDESGDAIKESNNNLSKILKDFMKDNPNVTDDIIASYILNVALNHKNFTDKPITTVRGSNLPDYIAISVYLFFGLENIRNTSSALINYMMLELIANKIKGYETFDEALSKMPMELSGAVAATRSLNKMYPGLLPMHYDYAVPKGEEKIISELVKRQANIFKDWLSLKFASISSFSSLGLTNNDFKKILVKLGKLINNGMGIDIFKDESKDIATPIIVYELCSKIRIDENDTWFNKELMKDIINSINIINPRAINGLYNMDKDDLKILLQEWQSFDENEWILLMDNYDRSIAYLQEIIGIFKVNSIMNIGEKYNDCAEIMTKFFPEVDFSSAVNLQRIGSSANIEDFLSYLKDSGNLNDNPSDLHDAYQIISPHFDANEIEDIKDETGIGMEDLAALCNDSSFVEFLKVALDYGVLSTLAETGCEELYNQYQSMNDVSLYAFFDYHMGNRDDENSEGTSEVERMAVQMQYEYDEDPRSSDSYENINEYELSDQY